MELKTGYKQTEVGVIPEDWEVKELGEVAFLKRGKFTPRPRNNPIFYGGDIPFVQTGDVTNSNGKIMEYTQTLNEGGLAVSTLFKKGTILMTIAANIGYTGILQIDMACPDSLVAIDGLEKIDNVFLNYYFSFKRQELDNLSTSGTQKNLNIELLKPFKIPFPPTLAEQTAIATALSDTDQYITHLEKLIAKKRSIKQGAMQELLKPKEGWVVRKLGEVGKTFGGLSGKTKADFQGGIYPYIPFMNIMNSPVIDTTYFDYVNISPSENQNKAQKEDLFFNGSSETPEEVGMCSVLLEDISNLYLNSFCFGFRLFNKQEIDGIYLSYFFRSGEGRKLIFSLAQGATRYNLSKANFLRLVMPIPKVEEQNRIATILSDMDAEISVVERKLEKARQVKQGMMQQLLTGKIRLI